MPTSIKSQQKSENASLSNATAELGSSLRRLIQSEIHLAKAEIGDTARGLQGYVIQAMVFGLLAAIGILPFIAFLVIGLGEILNHNYWLSSLIIAVLMTLVSGLMAFRAYAHLKEQDLSLPRTRTTFEHEKDHVTEKLRDVSEDVKNRRVA
jgi:uncharacterized membrane protein YqjE